MDDVMRNDQLTGGPRGRRSDGPRSGPVRLSAGLGLNPVAPQSNSIRNWLAPGDAFSVAVKLHHLAAERNMDRHLDGVPESLGLGPR
jgi:hypothetical protein